MDNIDFGKFVDYLEENNMIMEAGDDVKGKTFAEMADKKWHYLPKPKDGKDFGSSKTTKLLIREYSEDKWDVVLFSKTGGGSSAGLSKDDQKKGAAAASKYGVDFSGKKDKDRAIGSKDEPKVKSEAHKMEDWMSLTESMFTEKGQMINEAEGGSKNAGDTAMYKNTEYVAVKTSPVMGFESLLAGCVAIVTGKGDAGGSQLLKMLNGTK